MSQKAAFQIDNYYFNEVLIKLENKTEDIHVELYPAGIFFQESSTYELKIKFIAFGEDKGMDNPFVLIECIGFFKFSEVNSAEEIPGFFYRNAIALLFPYLRAFISTVTLQANIPPVILPTYNLSHLETPLRENTEFK